jgi:phage shock protein E
MTKARVSEYTPNAGFSMTTKFVMQWLMFIMLCCALPVRAQVPANAVWIDVRTPTEYASGHLEEAALIPYDGIEAGVARLQLEKDTPIYLYCAVGGRAEVAKKRLEAQNYTNVTNVGGLLDARKLAAGKSP